MTCKKLIVMVVLLSAILGVDAKAAGRSPRKTEKLYRKAGKWQRKLRDVWALLGVKPFLVQPGEEGDECVLKSKVEEDYVLKSTVEADACGTGTVLAKTVFGKMKCMVAPDYAETDPTVVSLADHDAALQTAEAEKQAKDEEIAALKAALAAKDEELADVEYNYFRACANLSPSVRESIC